MAETYYESSLTGEQIEQVLENPVLTTAQSLTDLQKATARNNIGVVNGIYFGVCSSTTSSLFKEVTIPGIMSYTNGLSVRILFQNSGGSIAYLNINNIGAELIMGSNLWDAGDVVDFVFSTSDRYWHMVNNIKASEQRYGFVKFATNSVSTNANTAVPSSVLRQFDSGVVTGLQVYSSTGSYDIGDRVRYGDNIYECSTAIATPESWDSSHWTQLKPMLGLLSVYRESITLSTSWSGLNPYTQSVTLSSGASITGNTKVDIQPDATVIAQMVEDGTQALYIENNNGTLTAYAIGGRPTASLTVQITYYETTQGSST